ncbi:phosphoribosylglycinamide formyltransferase [Halalkalibacterium ligniniphilum]|uniref:phosphoribosylglycinamide formyltransferase n=1 Tax=Halalkalibacterium ligniniphilum TaxID=1134413 RepID=UPI000344E094|nr:phosphoribosylglycinamide formyltransferase [Halalkalibacterium ligniniphilum]
MKRIAIFASGQGTNAQAIMEAAEQKQLKAEVVLLVTDRPEAEVVERAKAYGVEVFAFTPKAYSSKADFEREIVSRLESAHVDLVALAGYMRLIGPTLLGAYEGKIVNIHPSLLPSFQGMNAIEQAFKAKVKVTGVTIHFVDEGMDTGPIVAQDVVWIEEQDSIETLTKKIQAVEHRLYPATLQTLLSSKESIK